MMKKLFLLLPLTTIATIPVAMVSCQKGDPLVSKFNYTGMPKVNEIHKVGSIFDNETTVTDLEGNEQKVTLWDYFHAVEGEIISTADGDTITIRVTKQPNKLPSEKNPVVVDEVMRLRISNIDTLEENTPGVSDREKSLAAIDHEFADSLVLNQKVRVISQNWSNKTYDRHVANVFFGKDYQRNFGVEMLANGYTLARLDRIDYGIFLAKYEENRLFSDPDIRSLLMPYLAYAINDGYENKKGFYGAPINLANPMALSQEYAEHDKDMINNSSMILRPEYLPYPNLAKPKNNIYKYFEKL
ncbi:hypothetical protein AB5V95_02060 [Metamycoplasma spumans]|uniref:hypothetical protein n=1 Tax=Metamycoplasma spumans TaxID=92406 RepID=UPI0034DD7600